MMCRDECQDVKWLKDNLKDLVSPEWLKDRIGDMCFECCQMHGESYTPSEELE